MPPKSCYRQCALLVTLGLLVVGTIDATTGEESKSVQYGTSHNKQRTSSISRCKQCEVNGKTYRGHSRFSFEDGCSRFRCICRCDGSYNCPARHTIPICIGGKKSPSSESSSSSSSSKSSSSSSSLSSTHAGSSSHGSSSSTVEGHRGECRDCQVQGKEFKGHSYFTHVDGCTKYSNCICRCNGSWDCPADKAVSICNNNNTNNPTDSLQNRPNNESTSPSASPARVVTGSENIENRTVVVKSRKRCQSCHAGGLERRGNSYFELDETCIKYRYCLCRCNGSWNCPERFALNTCREQNVQNSSSVESKRESTCQTCRVKGETFAGGSSFEIQHGCIHYSDCQCRCNGSWSCPDTGASNICQTRRVSTCPGCEINLKKYTGNSYFSIQYGCVNYTNCVCNCNGSWSCPKTGAKSTCGGVQVVETGITSEVEVPTRNVKTTDNRVPAVCRRCRVYGKYFQGGSEFEVTNRCVLYRNCMCRCDGSWTCRPQFSRNICQRNNSRVTTSPRAAASRRQCSTCDAKGKIAKGNSYFNLTDGCTQFQNCLCRCDGSWDCPPRYSKDICKTSDRLKERGPFGCINCNAEGKIVKGGSRFNLIDGCIRYSDCQCNCDGSWACSGDKAKNICLNNTKSSDECLTCKATDGSLHKANSPFTFVKDCVEYQCDCFCDGGWTCPANRSRWVCTDKCKGCDVKGRKIASNTTFTHNTGCLEYTCDCHCNGSWSCPGRTAINTCTKGVNVNCNKCIVSSTEQYKGETDFVLRQDCLHYKCRCNCDGSYTCPGKDARNVCRGEKLGGCRTCVVDESKRQIFQGNTDFTFRKDCISYQCRCNCDGSWNCPAKDARNVCLGEVAGGCRVCRVSDTEVYRANTQFDLRKECIHYKCQCNCDGGWKCPGKDARDVCKGEVPGGCRSCKISENEFYPGNSNFEMVKNCIHYKCRCNCNGGYNCPGRTAKRVCRTNEPLLLSQCKKCKVSDREMFSGNSTFSLERGCSRYECKCDCDGSWKCPAEKTQNICTGRRQTVSELKSSQCRSCRVRNENIPSESTFKLQRRCYQYECTCKCNGKWSCNNSNGINTCPERQNRERKPSIRYQSEVTTRKDVLAQPAVAMSERYEHANSNLETNFESNHRTSSTDKDRNTNNNNNDQSIAQTNLFPKIANCRQCRVGNDVKQPNELFEIHSGCIKHKNCLCLCSGQYECAEEINICKTGASSNRPKSSSSESSSEKKEVTSFISARDMNNTRVVHGRDKSGRDYALKIDTDYSPSNVVDVRKSNDQTVNTRSYSSSHSSSAPRDSRRQPLRSSSSLSSSSSSSSLSSSVLVPDSSSERNGCTKCLANNKTYSTGANFDMRRGCVLYKCRCLCSGSYRCAVMSDNACTEEDRRSRCSNCVYHGMVFPGGLMFKVRQSCGEKTCQCHCNGTYTCPVSSTLRGCNLGIPHRSSVPSSSGSVFQANGGNVPLGTGYIVRTVQNNHKQPCTRNCHNTRTTAIRHNSIDTSHQCTSCTLEGRTHAGNSSFAIQKGCIYFDCFCECGGSWKCAGRMSQDCFSQVRPKTAPENAGCGSCFVQGTEFPARSKFLLRQGCFEYQCSCNCDGSWVCPSQQPNNKCPPKPHRVNQERFEPFRIGKDTSVTINENQISREQESGNQDTRSGSHRRYSSSLRQQHEQCIECKIDGQVFIPNKDFQILRDTCYLHTCQCFCNGTYTCPQGQVQNVCNRRSNDPRRNELNVQVGEQQEDVDRNVEPVSRRSGSVSGCQRCFMHGQHVEPLAMFIRHEGCFETVCHCLCNGEASCPDTASINVCELPDKKPMGERPGCKVGRRTHYTRVFALVEDCAQRVCICHDDGTWTCRRSTHDKKVC